MAKASFKVVDAGSLTSPKRRRDDLHTGRTQAIRNLQPGQAITFGKDSDGFRSSLRQACFRVSAEASPIQFIVKSVDSGLAVVRVS